VKATILEQPERCDAADGVRGTRQALRNGAASMARDPPPKAMTAMTEAINSSCPHSTPTLKKKCNRYRRLRQAHPFRRQRNQTVQQAERERDDPGNFSVSRHALPLWTISAATKTMLAFGGLTGGPEHARSRASRPQRGCATVNAVTVQMGSARA
jgi:hypothetical protein